MIKHAVYQGQCCCRAEKVSGCGRTIASRGGGEEAAWARKVLRQKKRQMHLEDSKDSVD